MSKIPEKKVDSKKPNCYECKYRGEIPGDAHSCCHHPAAKADSDNPLGKIMAIFASVGRVAPVQGKSADEIHVTGNPHGIRHGWFSWPWNFDPVWLETCDGFKKAK